MNAAIVTGYAPIEGHVRSAETYHSLAAALYGSITSRGRFYKCDVDETWLAKRIRALDVVPAIGDYPAKNTLAYHCVQHQKFAWLAYAAADCPDIETFVWMDYGIGHLGITPEIVDAFMTRLEPHDFAMPGCWENFDTFPLTMETPHWRFCGSVFIVPREAILPLYHGVQRQVDEQLAKSNVLTWEVNTLAAAERNGYLPPIRWYHADHNPSMLTNYRS